METFSSLNRIATDQSPRRVLVIMSASGSRMASVQIFFNVSTSYWTAKSRSVSLSAEISNEPVYRNFKKCSKIETLHLHKH